MRAKVTSVSEFPSTQQAMLANLGNQDLVNSFTKMIDTPIELRVEILASDKTQSGFQWTSPAGPPGAVQAGTLCQAQITVRERPPISLVIPLLREKLGL
jgi:HlyD family secretion protein